MSILEQRYAGDPASLPCVTPGDVALWRSGEWERSTAWVYCLDADRQDCARHRAEGRCSRSDWDWDVLCEHDERGEADA